jgi:acetyl-CoA acetyltransferase
MHDVVILGAGIHPFGRFPDRSYQELALVAARAALSDAGVAWREIDAAYLARMYLPATSAARILRQLGSTGIAVCDVEAACASGAVALRQGMLSIQAGESDLVLVVGAEKMPRGFMDPSMIYNRWQIEMGLSVNPAYWAMRARRHMHDYGTTEEQIAKVALKNHAHSVHNPNAMYRKAFTLPEIMASQVICDPIRLLEVCAANDGAAALVLASSAAAARIGGAKATIAAAVHGLAQYSSSDFRAPSDSVPVRVRHKGPTATVSASAYERAGIGPDEIDCFEVQDTDAFCEIEAYEELGLCGAGEGGRLIDDNITAIGGRRPVNMSGGLISKGEPVGASHLGQIVELVTQLNGNAGARQVAGARVGLAHVLGAGGNCAVTILRR